MGHFRFVTHNQAPHPSTTAEELKWLEEALCYQPRGPADGCCLGCTEQTLVRPGFVNHSGLHAHTLLKMHSIRDSCVQVMS